MAVTDLGVLGSASPSPPAPPRRTPIAGTVAIMAAAGLLSGALVYVSDRRPAPAPAPVAHTVRIETIGSVATGGALVRAGGQGSTLRAGQTRSFLDLQAVTVAIAAADVTAGRAACRILVDGVTVADEIGSGSPGQAVCIWMRP